MYFWMASKMILLLLNSIMRQSKNHNICLCLLLLSLLLLGTFFQPITWMNDISWKQIRKRQSLQSSYSWFAVRSSLENSVSISIWIGIVKFLFFWFFSPQFYSCLLLKANSYTGGCSWIFLIIKTSLADGRTSASLNNMKDFHVGLLQFPNWSSASVAYFSCLFSSSLEPCTFS